MNPPKLGLFLRSDWFHSTSPEDLMETGAVPLFDSRCEKCGHVTEFLETANSASRHVCEQCGSRRMRKEMSPWSMFGGSSVDGSGARAQLPIPLSVRPALAGSADHHSRLTFGRGLGEAPAPPRD